MVIPFDIRSILATVALLLLMSPVLFAQESRSVNFHIKEDDLSITGTVTVHHHFLFWGYPYLKLQYSDLVITSVTYWYGTRRHRSLQQVPFHPRTDSYHISVAVSGTIPVNRFGMLITSPGHDFRLNANIYTLSDTYSDESIDQYFRERNDPVFKDQEVWEKSVIPWLLGITVNGLSGNIINQIKTLIQEEDRADELADGNDSDFDDFLSGGHRDTQPTDNSSIAGFDDFLSGNAASTNDDEEKGEIFDDFLRGTSDNSNFHFEITRKSGKTGVTDDEGNILIPFRNWNVATFDPISRTAEIEEQIEFEMKYHRIGETRPCVQYTTYRRYRVDSMGSTIGKEDTYFKVGGDRHCNLMLGNNEAWRNRNATDLQRAENWVQSEINRITNQFINLGYKKRN